MFLPTLVMYLGNKKDPWTIDDGELCAVLQRIWNTVYPKLPCTVKTGESVHGLVRVSPFNL